jgi:hypothetical protein
MLNKFARALQRKISIYLQVLRDSAGPLHHGFGMPARIVVPARRKRV